MIDGLNPNIAEPTADEYKNDVFRFLPNRESLGLDSFPYFFGSVIDTYQEKGVDERLAASLIADTFEAALRHGYIELSKYQERMRDRYKSATDWFERCYPQGIGYIHPEHGTYFGLNVLTKQFIKEFLGVHEEQLLIELNEQKDKHELPNGNDPEYNLGYVAAINKVINLISKK